MHFTSIKYSYSTVLVSSNIPIHLLSAMSSSTLFLWKYFLFSLKRIKILLTSIKKSILNRYSYFLPQKDSSYLYKATLHTYELVSCLCTAFSTISCSSSIYYSKFIFIIGWVSLPWFLNWSFHQILDKLSSIHCSSARIQGVNLLKREGKVLRVLSYFSFSTTYYPI